MGKADKNFEEIKRHDENGAEFWHARELQGVLDYKKWENFAKVIDTAKIACKISQQEVSDHFLEIRKTVEMPSKAKPKQIKDYKLTRYACYLIVMNGDPRKEVIALGQTYFAVKTSMGSAELGANIFRITQTEELMRKNNVSTPASANETHFTVGKTVRKAIEDLGGTMPENLPLPEKSIKQLEKEKQKQIDGEKI